MTRATDDDLEDLYEHAPCGYASMLPNGTIVRINETLLTWSGLTRDEVVGTPFQDLLTMPGRIFYDTHYMPLLAMQGFAREIAFDLHRRDAPPLPTIITTMARRDADGAIDLYRMSVFESTSRRSYERELLRQRNAAEQSATARAALLAMLSHDIRSPLSSILMALDLVENATTPEQLRRFRDVMRRASNSALELVNAILEHSRLEAGGAVWEAEPTNLRDLVNEINSVHAVKAEAKGVELRTVFDPAIPETLLVDRFKLSQLITNLVSNAIKFTSAGHVQLEMRGTNVGPDAADVELRVSDTGIGIPPSKLDTIFDEFQQATADTARRYGGAGLGLAISRKVAALAGATIRVESTVGSGSVFSCVLHLPIANTKPVLSANGQ